MKRFLLAVQALLLICALPTEAGAQTRPMPVQAVLREVKLISESANDTRLQLTFEPKTNSYGPTGLDRGRPGIGFASTVRGNSAVSPPLRGLVRTIDFDQQGSVLLLHFGTAAPGANVSAVQTGDKVIEVDVSTGVPAGPVKTDIPTGATSGLPAASEPPPGEDGYELVRLKYADVSEVVGLLTEGVTVKSNDLFLPREPAFGSSGLTGANSYSSAQTSQSPGTNDDPLGQSVDSSMAIDRRLNAIWLKGSPDRIARMKAMIALIDVPLDSVILETQFLELTESGSKAIGIDFTNANGQVGVFTVGSGGFIPVGVSQGCSSDGNGNRSCSGHVTGASFQAAIYAQIAKGNGRIVSKPRISAQSGSTAKIITGDALPILTAITLSGVNGVSQQVQYVNVGVTLQIAPRVSEDGYVMSHVFCVVSSVSGYSQGYPTISQREAETSATVHDGESFVIGGLTQEDVINSKSKIPLLGDIPLVGQAFRTDRSTRAKTELYIVVTPHVIRRGSAVGVPSTVQIPASALQ
ncbi:MULTISPECIES: secretin N-terminal domain-containing protein [Sphingomonas]|uniref:secretin N-terminal domain-containing protein n=1 Tax=Sphingomonas TaxID=13687 RepID=UPI000DEFC65D|nr:MULTISPECIES: secretin N-terminal domain-containing protein [Sphingomonas]